MYATANLYANLTVYINAFDSGSLYSTPLSFQINANESTSIDCISRDPNAILASPGVLQDRFASGTITSTITTSSPSGQYTLAPSRSNNVNSSSNFASNGGNSTITEYGDMSGTIAGLSISTGVLSLAFLILLFLHLRLKRKFKRALMGQATVGKWMNKRPSGTDKNEESDENRRTQKEWDTFANTLKNSKRTSQSGLSFFSSQTGESRLSSFFNNRSASRNANNNDKQFQSNSTRTSTTSSNSNPFEDYSEIASRTSERDDSNESLKRSSNVTSTTISDIHTIQSEKSHLSSAISEQASTVGGVSAISDEYWSRTKASTISPVNASSNSQGSSKGLLKPH